MLTVLTHFYPIKKLTQNLEVDCKFDTFLEKTQALSGDQYLNLLKPARDIWFYAL